MPIKRNLMGASAPAHLAGAICGGSAALSSAGTGSIANATQISGSCTPLAAAASLDAYLLPSTAQGSQNGDEIKVFTTSSTSAVVFAGTGETINNAASVTVAQYKMAIFKRFTATQWGMIITP